jgi:hypothetical protein
MRRRILILLAVAIVTSLVVAGASARAAAPVHDWVPIDETFTFDDCGFTVEEHDVLTLHLISWFDASGTRVRRLVVAPNAKITYTNPDTGASVSTANPFTVHRSANPDGSETIMFTGLVFHINGGRGDVYVDSGNEVILFANGDVTPVSAVGPTADLCEALNAAIG